MKRLKIIDTIVKEPLGGAHRDREQTFSTVRKSILKAYNELKDLPENELIALRQEKFFQMGVYEE
jgi:acetyl-CoA carboxylase carboxyl transferase subunit alpha